MKSLEQPTQKYDAATVFVSVATVVVMIELSLMWLLVPSPSTATAQELDVLMEQVCSETSISETSDKIECWTFNTTQLSESLSSDATQWQMDLENLFAFGMDESAKVTTHQGPSSNSQFADAADYAAGQLFLQSVMTGRIPLANIDGKIYRGGDMISLRGGEIVMVIVEISSDFVVIEHAYAPEDVNTQRTIYVSRDARFASGNDVQ